VEGPCFPFHLDSSNCRLDKIIKGNFDVAMRGSLAIAAIVISDDNGSIFAATTLKLSSADALQGEAHAALLAAYSGFGSIFVEGMLFLLF
jgi:hypothetical protein